MKTETSITTATCPNIVAVHLRIYQPVALIVRELGDGNRVKRFVLAVLLAVSLGTGSIRAAIFTVTNANDSGDGTLRQAITQANLLDEASTINFNIPLAMSHVIQPESPLPVITKTMVIDGRTQLGYAGTPVIEINGTSAAVWCVDCFEITASGCEIYGLAINNFMGCPGHPSAAVHVVGCGNAIIRNNYLGLTVSGVAVPNNCVGVRIENAWGVEVGGPGFGGNVISGNNPWYGVLIEGYSASNNVVEGNLIGTDVTGSGRLGNGDGIRIRDMANHNLVGGWSVGSRNIISGNYTNGVLIQTGSENMIAGNYIGTDRAGTAAVPNDIAGVQIGSGGGSLNNQIVSNVISGNSLYGVRLSVGVSAGGLVTSNLISGNLIGVNVNGAARGNGFDGIAMMDWCSMQNVAVSNVIAFNGHDGVFITGTNNCIGAGNRIHDNGHNGVTVGLDPVAGPGLFDRIQSNSIYSNGGIGIDLGNDGPTLNDRLDGDLGANNLQNFPLVTNAVHSWGRVTVGGTLDSERNKTYMLDFFWNRCRIVCPCSCEHGGYYIGSLAVTTDFHGYAIFNTTFMVQVPTGLGANPAYITATATSPDGNTSEFSDCCLVNETLTARAGGGGNMVVSWSDNGLEECVLQSSPGLSPPSWSDVTDPPSIHEDGEGHVILPATNSAMLFRVRCP